MLQFLPVFDGNTIAIRASGKLTHEDYQEFLPQLEEQINELKKVSILFELDNFSGWELDAAKDDFKFGMKHIDDFERIAIVGDKAWEHWMTLMAKPFMLSGEVRYFNRENLQDAWDWLREKQEFEKAAEQLHPYKNIVVAVDFSLYSKHASKRAIELANHYQASLTLLNVVHEYIPYSYYGDTIDTYLIEPEVIGTKNQIHIEHAESQMKEFVNDLDTDLAINTKVLIGETNSVIVSFLAAQKADLAIFGAKKKKGLNMLLGSTPHYVQNRTRCETLIVPVQDSVF
jgi:universal stress protein A